MPAASSDPCWTLGQISEETGGWHVDRLTDLTRAIGAIHRSGGTYYISRAGWRDACNSKRPRSAFSYEQFDRIAAWFE